LTTYHCHTQATYVHASTQGTHDPSPSIKLHNIYTSSSSPAPPTTTQLQIHDHPRSNKILSPSSPRIPQPITPSKPKPQKKLKNSPSRGRKIYSIQLQPRKSGEGITASYSTITMRRNERPETSGSPSFPGRLFPLASSTTPNPHKPLATYPPAQPPSTI